MPGARGEGKRDHEGVPFGGGVPAPDLAGYARTEGIMSHYGYGINVMWQ
jgi:hypothetical protein